MKTRSKSGIVKVNPRYACLATYEVPHGTLNEVVYMEQPPGFQDPKKPHHVCLLRKSLYGLRQAPRAWFDKFSNFLLEYGFFCSSTDPSLFIYHTDLDTILLLLYVDDIVLTGSSSQSLSNLIHSLSLQFHMKDLGPLHYFLGIEVKNTSDHLFLCQTKYAKDLLTRAHMLECKPITTPVSLKPTVLINDSDLLFNPFEYRSLVGGLQYLTLTRPDVAYATNQLCQKLQKPTIADLHRLKRVLRYVKGTLNLGVFIHSRSSLHLGSNLISWAAKKQSTVSRSSTEAEYRALASTSAELTWISFVLRDIGCSLTSPTQLFCDNKSAISLTINPVLHARTKHIEIDFHFVREKVSSGSLQVKCVPSNCQIADIFTKPLSRTTHYQLRIKLGIGYSPISNLRGAVKNSLQKNKSKGKEIPGRTEEAKNRGSKTYTSVKEKTYIEEEEEDVHAAEKNEKKTGYEKSA